MDFYLNIGTITKTISDYLNTYQTLEEREKSRNLSISELTELGWSGEARDKFLEAHEEKIKLYEKLKEDIKYMISGLEEEKQRALLLKTRCEDFINCIERNGQGGAITGDDEGVISLDYSSQYKINNYVNNCTNEDYVKLNSNFRRIEDILSELEYTSFGISGEVGSAKTSVKDQTESLTEFDDSFNVYYAGVKDMESNICSVFGKISASSDSPFKNSSVIAPNGELDKNILTNAVLKNQNGFTIEKLGTNTNITNGMNLENLSYEVNNNINTGKVYSPIGTKDKNGNIISFVDACRAATGNGPLYGTFIPDGNNVSSLNDSNSNNFDESVYYSPGNAVSIGSSAVQTLGDAWKPFMPEIEKNLSKVSKIGEVGAKGSIGLDVGYGIYKDSQNLPANTVISNATVNATFDTGCLVASTAAGTAAGSLVADTVAGAIAGPVGAVVGFGVGVGIVCATQSWTPIKKESGDGYESIEDSAKEKADALSTAYFNDVKQDDLKNGESDLEAPEIGKNVYFDPTSSPFGSW